MLEGLRSNPGVRHASGGTYVRKVDSQLVASNSKPWTLYFEVPELI